MNEVPWWILCCRVYARSFAWRQVPAQVSLEEIKEAQGERPDPPLYPPEPVFTGDPSSLDEKGTFEREHRAWNQEVQKLSRRYQQDMMDWESRGMQLSQRWDLNPVPELTPFDSRPPEQREWIPVRVFEREALRAQKTRRIPVTVRNWRQRERGEWEDTLIRGWEWSPYSTEELERMLRDQVCIYLPETLILAVPGESFLPFLNQLDRNALALVRCQWDPEKKDLVPVGRVPQTFVQPAVEIVASLALSELGTLPITTWPDVRENLHKVLTGCGWEPGQDVPVTREQFATLEVAMSMRSTLPDWYAAPEYRSLAAVNLCHSEAKGQWGAEYLWRPLLEGDSDWRPTL